MLGAALEQVEANAPGAAAGKDPEYLHQLRVGLRRLRAALQAFRPLLPKRKRKRLVSALRRAMPALGAARDLDVLSAWLKSVRAPRELLAAVGRRQARAQRRVTRLLASADWPDLLAQSRGLRAKESSGDFSGAAIERAYRKVAKKARGIDWLDASDRHALRVRLKRLRYTCDSLAPSAAPLAQLKRLQDVLGELNDVRVGRGLLAELRGGRAMDRRLAAREAALLRKLAPAWRAFERRAPFWQPRGRTPRRAAT